MGKTLLRGVVAITFAAGFVPASGAVSSGEVWNESEISEALGIEAKPGGVGRQFVTDQGVPCGVAAILKTTASVNLYVSAGDVVATNPEGSAGVKIVAPESKTCKEAAEGLLESLG